MEQSLNDGHNEVSHDNEYLRNLIEKSKSKKPSNSRACQSMMLDSQYPYTESKKPSFKNPAINHRNQFKKVLRSYDRDDHDQAL